MNLFGNVLLSGPPSSCTFLIFLEHLLQEGEALPDLLQLLFKVSERVLMTVVMSLLHQALDEAGLLLQGFERSPQRLFKRFVLLGQHRLKRVGMTDAAAKTPEVSIV